jgi:hypothetical protein
MSFAERICIRDAKTLSDDWYVLKKTTFDYCRHDGSWQTLGRETYGRGDGARILLHDPARRMVILTRQFRFTSLCLRLARPDRGTRGIARQRFSGGRAAYGIGWNHSRRQDDHAAAARRTGGVHTRRHTPGPAVAIACTPKPRNSTPDRRVTHSACRR